MSCSTRYCSVTISVVSGVLRPPVGVLIILYALLRGYSFLVFSTMSLHIFLCVGRREYSFHHGSLVRICFEVSTPMWSAMCCEATWATTSYRRCPSHDLSNSPPPICLLSVYPLIAQLPIIIGRIYFHAVRFEVTDTGVDQPSVAVNVPR